jgi:glycosyltransferase involved in cell wall biosynthesis
MRVAIIIPRIDQLGPILFIQALVNQLFDMDNLKLRIFYIDKTVDPNIQIMVPVERLDYRNFPFGDYDIVHTNGIRPDFFAFINRKKIKYHISTIHNFVFDDLAFTYNKFISLIFGNIWLLLWRRADKLICVSMAMEKYYAKWFPSSKLEVIYYGISETNGSFVPDSDVIHAITEFRSRGLKVIGCAAILTKRKGIDKLLYLVSEEKEFALVVIGNGKELRNLQRLAEKLKIKDRCEFNGFRSKAVNYFSYFDFLIMPSLSEGFGLVLIEAAQQKVPIICSDIEVFNELFNNDEVTFFNPDDLTTLNEALKVSAETVQKKIESAYTRFTNSYTDRIMAKNYCQLYQSFS